MYTFSLVGLISSYPGARSRILLSHAKPEATPLSQESAINWGRKHSGTDKCSFSQAWDIMFSHQGLNTPPVYSHPREKRSPGNRHMVDVPWNPVSTIFYVVSESQEEGIFTFVEIKETVNTGSRVWSGEVFIAMFFLFYFSYFFMLL